MFCEKKVLVTGGTGSFGKAFIKKLIEKDPQKVIVYSRDEYKQHEMAKEFTADCMRFFLGDVRDRDRLTRACHGVDYIVHAAALKQVPALEYNPTEAVKTNIEGAMNVVYAAIENSVRSVVSLSTDKAVNPVNLYGATKLCAEKIFTAANVFGPTKFSSVRYGNVIGSRGSVIPLFMKIKEEGGEEFPVTDRRMTRFWITLDQACELVFGAFKWMRGGEIYVPRVPSMKITDVARAVSPLCSIKEIGIRAGEKLHESLISSDMANVWVVDGTVCEPATEIYTSDKNSQLSQRDLRLILGLEDIYV